MRWRTKDINVALGPTLEPLGYSACDWRVGEVHSVENYLTGGMGGALVSGMAGAGIITAAKHFILNEQETNRLRSLAASDLQETVSVPTLMAYNVIIGDKTFHETHLTLFYDTVRAGMGGALYGFPGFVLADVDVQRTGVSSANGRLDYGGSACWSEANPGAGLDDGLFTEAHLDDIAVRNLMGYYRYAKDDGSSLSTASVLDDVGARANRSSLARTHAAEALFC
jgi:beta-glucosidase